MQDKLILLMKEEKVTNRELAELLGISEKQFARKLSGLSEFKCTEMFILSNFFHKQVDDIFLPINVRKTHKKTPRQ